MKKSFLKSKTVHGLKTGNHSNPNVLRAARASGGSQERRPHHAALQSEEG